MKLATWNVNSIRQREGHVRRWLGRVQPDVLLLQEIKCETAAFPALAFADLGYRAAVVGQKAYNGVAALCRCPFEVTQTALPGLPPDDAQARYIELAAGDMRIAGIYLPNGNSGGPAGFAYKLAWMDALAARAEALLAEDTPLVIAGDFNVCPTDADLSPGALPPGDALVHPDTRLWTFWDYQAAAWPRDIGLRIDHALLSPTLAERLTAAMPDRQERGEDAPSDHVPVLVEID